MLQLVDALGWCLDLGITCVSVYAFSIDNFKRSEPEVAALMDLAEDKLQELLQVGRRLAPAVTGPKAICMDAATEICMSSACRWVHMDFRGWCRKENAGEALGRGVRG